MTKVLPIVETGTAFRRIDSRTLLAQIGTGNVMAISGGRVGGIFIVDEGETILVGVTLPVRYGYSVEVLLAADDTYTVRRVFERGHVRTVKGEQTDVYCDEIGEAAYVASCYVNRTFGAHNPARASA